jgi:hypothetical protein
MFAPAIEARDPAGVIAGRFDRRAFFGGGTLRWHGRALLIRRDSLVPRTYVLMEEGRRLAVIDGRGWRNRPLNVAVLCSPGIDAGLLLFASFVAQALAEDARRRAVAGGGMSASGGGGC